MSKNREIKFRGKCVETERWLKGHYLMREDSFGEVHLISVKMSDDFVYEERQVDPSTVGQYTGLKDKYGKEIYEGDINEDDYVFEYMNSIGGFILRHSSGWYRVGESDIEGNPPFYKIIGSIHDNKPIEK